MKRRAVWISLGGIALVGGAMAQVSIGPTLVFDPTVAAKVISETIQVVKVAAATASTYEQLKMEAQFLQNKYVWRGAIISGMDSFLNTTPVTAPWAVATMRGLNAARGYGQAAVTLQSNPRMIVMGNPMTPFYASAQLGAANNTAALQAIGNARFFTTQMVQPVQNCETSALASDTNSNTEAAQQNISNGCAVLALRNQQALLELETARTGVELAQAKMQTDAQAEYLNMVTGSENTALQQAVVPGNVYAIEQSYVPK